MYPMHPELRAGIAEERIHRLAEDMAHRNGAGPIRRAFGRLLPARSAHPQGCALDAPMRKPRLSGDLRSG